MAARARHDALDQAVVLVDLTLIDVGAAVEHLIERDPASERRRLEDGVGAGQIAQALLPAGLRVSAALNRAQPIELLDGKRIAQPQRKELLVLRARQC